MGDAMKRVCMGGIGLLWGGMTGFILVSLVGAALLLVFLNDNHDGFNDAYTSSLGVGAAIGATIGASIGAISASGRYNRKISLFLSSASITYFVMFVVDYFLFNYRLIPMGEILPLEPMVAQWIVLALTAFLYGRKTAGDGSTSGGLA